VLYEFAMTPDLFDASIINTDRGASTILVELLRGIAENGLLANLNGDQWLRHVIEERTKTLSPALRDKVLKLISVLNDRHRLVRHPRCMAISPGTDKEWLKLVFISHDRIPFNAIILSQSLIDRCGRGCDALVEFFGSLDSAQWESRRKRTLSLTRTAAAYRTALTPILRHARSLALIDPYLNTQQSRYFDTVTICSNMLGKTGNDRIKGRIDIHAEAKNQDPFNRTVADPLAAWEQKLRPLITTDGHRFRVFLWESHPDSESMHDRFILTDKCGISVPGGLDCRTHSHPNRTDWSFLDEDVRQLHWSEYDPAVSPFNLMGWREIS
jgi:hypothetical protein